MIDIIGYVALGLALVAMMSKRIKTLRWVHLVSCMFYMTYGIVTKANPVAIGAVLFGLIHVFHLYKLNTAKNKLIK
jgi:hypothetical protein